MYFQDGVFIIDTPGIGKDEVGHELVQSYLQEAFVFIYVFNSEHATDVQDDTVSDNLSFNYLSAPSACNITTWTSQVASESGTKRQSGSQNTTLTCPARQVMFWAEFNSPLL